MSFYLAQGVGIISVVFSVQSFYTKKKEKTLLYQILANICFAIQYLLLGSMFTSLVCLLAVIRGIVFSVYDEKSKNVPVFWLLFFLSLISLNLWWNYEGILSFLPYFGSVFVTYGLWQNNLNVYRFCGFLNAFFLIFSKFVINLPCVSLRFILQSPH